MARVYINKTHHNPNRDVAVYPWIEPKIDILTESVKKTGQWKNMIAVPVEFLNGDMTVEDIASLNEKCGVTGIYDGEVIIPWGHHRLETLTRMNEEFMFVTLEAIDADALLLQMILENHDDYSGNMQVFLESVFQAKKALTEKINAAEDFDDFRQQYPGIYKSKKAWEQMLSGGVTSGAIKAFLGETWDQYSIGYALSVISGIDDGLYSREQACACNTIRQMDAFDKLCREIYAQDLYPLYYKQEFVDGIAELLADQKKGLTVVQLSNARKNVKDSGTNPLKSFKADMKKAFHPVNEIDILTGAADSVLTLADLPEHDGFKDYADLAEVIQKIEKKRAKEAVGEEGGGEAQDAVDGGGDELEIEEGGSLEAADEESARAEASEAGDEEVSAEELVAGFINTSNAFVSACNMLNSLTDEQLEAAEGLPQVIADAVSAVAEVGVRVTTKTSLKKLIG